MPLFNPYVYGAYNPYMPQTPQMPQTQQAPQTQQIQDNGFVRVKSIDEAKNFPVAPGNSFTFKVDGAPYLCTKTMGFSPLEQPRFEAFQLVKVEDGNSINQTENTPRIGSQDATEYATKEELHEVKGEVNEVKEIVKKLKEELKNFEVGA